MNGKNLTPEVEAEINKLYEAKAKLPEGHPERKNISRKIMILLGFKPGQFREPDQEVDKTNSSESK